MKYFLLTIWSVLIRLLLMIPLNILIEMFQVVENLTSSLSNCLYKITEQIRLIAPMPWVLRLEQADTAHKAKVRDALLSQLRGL